MIKSLNSGIMGNISEGDKSVRPQVPWLWQELIVEEGSDKVFGIQAYIEVGINK